MIMTYMKRYCLKQNGAIYDTLKKKEIPLEKVVKLLNKYHKDDWDRWHNSGW